jgi:uncharacterized protein (DUF1501 family)
MYTSRRTLLQSTALLAAGSLAPRVWAQRAPAGQGQGRMVVVFLRGAYDGLSALVPYTDKDYYALRPNIAIAAPDGTRETALKLNDQWALHPAMAPLLPLWQQGVMAAIPCAGLPKPNRSHFDAQYLMEIGLPEKSSTPVGWLNKLAVSAPSAAIGVGESNPAILAGQAPVKLIPRGEQAERRARARAAAQCLDGFVCRQRCAERGVSPRCGQPYANLARADERTQHDDAATHAG